MKLPQNLNLVTIHELKQNQTTKKTQAMNTLIKMGRQTNVPGKACAFGLKIKNQPVTHLIVLV